jgi:methionyl-tRNA formyltransferase
MIKVLFFGSSKFCLPVLESITKNFKISAVVTKSDKKIGPKQIITPSLPKQFAMSHNINVYTPDTKGELLTLANQFQNFAPDIAVSSDYGIIIPQEIFSLPKYGTLNIHFSRLPFLRGSSPAQYTILTGQKTAWISIFLIDRKMDTGDIIWQKEIPLSGNETTAILYDKLFKLSAQYLPEIIKTYTSGLAKPRKQDHTKATYTKLLSREDGYIPPEIIDTAITGKNIALRDKDIPQNSPVFEAFRNSNITTIALERALRAFTPWPGIWTNIKIKDKNSNIKNFRLKILKAHLDSSTPLNQQPTNTNQVITILVLDLVQLEGKKPVSWTQFQTGYPDYSFT